MRFENMPFIRVFCKMCSDGWLRGYHERNGGNASVRLTAAELAGIEGLDRGGAWHKLAEPIPQMAGAYVFATASGKYLRNVADDVAGNCGLVEIAATGDAWRAVWGFADGAQPTSELPAHLMAHAIRMEATEGKSRVLYHAHPSSVIALTAIEQPDACSLTRLLWQVHTESVVAFPGGVGVCPWMVPGSQELARATAEQLEKFDACIWQLHGVFASGATCDEAFGLVHAIDKAAEVALAVRTAAKVGEAPQRITDAQLREVARAYSLPIREEFLD